MLFRLSVVMADSKWERIHRWLAAPDPSPNYYAALKKPQPKIDAWFIEGRQFGQWCRELESVIWLYGFLAAGTLSWLLPSWSKASNVAKIVVIGLLQVIQRSENM
jgi:hypothetical protein